MLNGSLFAPAVAGLRLVSPVLPVTRHVPFVLQQAILEPILARLLAAPLAMGELDMLQGRWLKLTITDLGLSWCVSRDRLGLRVCRDQSADACIAGSWRDFLLLASRQEDPDTLFFRRRLQLSGDTELGLAVKNLLDSLDPEHLPPRLWQALQALGRAARDL
ncbi:ubiquinone anaerobic biosynthesis accessory factor UbiT [Halopseudomonas salegens]|uniref:Ubiquinone biosynthesis accessory factor UbiT n=1 Tax=Halopseudomonas salegens TaxID=1434072 RepID=A0A1H2GG56_9GAMM|nr:SCP2 sterol-binding domain-containing protein [Halopseudomonas salegens]SDU18524.1 Predicted lipid carrier protein YhbT, contains SCP2 domain [Halopseudomonas salegens]